MINPKDDALFSRRIDVSRAAYDTIVNFLDEPMSRDAIDINIMLAVDGFIRRYKDCKFFRKHSTHSAPFLCLKEDGFDEDGNQTLHLHIARGPNSWGVGTPDELPLLPGYWDERVIEESQMIMRAAGE